MTGLRAVATVGINGKDVPLTVDSGAFFSFLTDAAVEQLGLPVTRPNREIQVEGLTGRVDTRLTTVKRLRLQKGEIPDVEFVVGGNEPGSGTMGLLGRNFLAFTDTEYDLAHGMIRLMFPEGDCQEVNLAYWAGDKAVSELALPRDPRYRTPAIIAAVQVNGEEVRALFDTGARSALSLAAARRAGLKDADMKPHGLIYGAGRGEAKAWTAPVREVTIGDETIKNSILKIGDFHMDDADMLIGIDFFLSHRVYVSKSRRRMFFTYAGGPVFSLDTATPGQAAAPAAEEGAAVEQPKDAAGYARRGAAFAARKALAPALADLDRACELAPDVADYFLRRAEVHIALKQSSEALRDVNTALRLDPTHAQARLLRAGYRANTDDRDGALDDLQALDKAVAPQDHVRRDMGRLYRILDRQDLAVLQWNHWIAAHRNQVDLHEVLNERCWAKALLGIELDQALKDCDEALERKPQTAAYLDSRAWVHLRRGELRDALSDFDRSLRIRPKQAWTLYGRGIVRIRLGQAEEGRIDLDSARALLPSIDAATARHGVSQADWAERPAVTK
ncbi:pepsin/retropepsin-like aspartic protease family protein [Piscinibacter terrae]|nr:pepsin/retropepsin-like aspartic protease family protein [Albitalea terrae]